MNGESIKREEFCKYTFKCLECGEEELETILIDGLCLECQDDMAKDSKQICDGNEECFDDEDINCIQCGSEQHKIKDGDELCLRCLLQHHGKI